MKNLRKRIEILVVDDEEFEKVLRHAVTLPANDKIKGVLEHFAEDDEAHIVKLSHELLNLLNGNPFYLSME